MLAWSFFDIACGKKAGLDPCPGRNKPLTAMKTIDVAETGLPSFETEWPKKAENKRETTMPRTHWASERLQQMLQSGIMENTWRGFRGYDSPLAG